MPEENTSVGRNFYHDYKFLEGLLAWYFGEQVSLTYSCFPELDIARVPLVFINGELLQEGKLTSDLIVKQLETLGAERLD